MYTVLYSSFANTNNTKHAFRFESIDGVRRYTSKVETLKRWQEKEAGYCYASKVETRYGRTENVWQQIVFN